MASRTLVSLGDDRIARLDQIAAVHGRSRAALIRDAVDRLIASDAEEEDRLRRLAALRAGFGAWKDRTDIGDAVEWQRRERASWTRPWDDDYEDVKAEFPELFDAEDDRQRAIYLDQLRGVQPSPKS
ncbi:MAG: ribbon-helix-helix domain-containing protein [Pseudomonadota bacterium]|jgi:predicted transcriptional regulator|nr:ribbon-helix-helix domain-containing protein [Pseudomonadota bacterium]